MTALAAVGPADGPSTAFDLVLIDARMPDMDGFALAHALQQRGSRAALVMMLTTAGRRTARTNDRELRIDVLVLLLLGPELLAHAGSPVASSMAAGYAAGCKAFASMSASNPIGPLGATLAYVASCGRSISRRRYGLSASRANSSMGISRFRVVGSREHAAECDDGHVFSMSARTLPKLRRV